VGPLVTSAASTQRSPVPTDITLAFAGHAPNHANNVRYELADALYLASPDEDGFYDKPDRWRTITFYVLLTDGQVPEGLETTLNMLADIGDPDRGDVQLHIVTDKSSGRIAKWGRTADTVEEHDDPIARLISILSDASNPRLLINYDGTDADDEELLRQAWAASIRVEDFVMGRTELLPNEEEQPAPEPEPEEQEDPEPPRRRASRRPAEELEEREEELEDAAPAQEEPQVTEVETLEEEVAAAHRAQDMQSTIAVGTIEVSSETLRQILSKIGHASFYLQSQDTANAARRLEDVRWAPLTTEVMQAEDALYKLLYPGELYADAVKATEKAAPKKQQGQRKKVVWDEDAGEWKPAGRGRTRRGIRTGWMDVDGTVTEEA
jgi:hypothetical protein